MSQQIVGPQGVPLLSPKQPQQLFADMQMPDGTVFRLPAVVVQGINPQVVEQLAQALAPLVAQIVVGLLQGNPLDEQEVPESEAPLT